jgi:hypothetical protein
MATQTYAHIYKARNKTWNLILSNSPMITAEFVIAEYNVTSKPEAKRIAKEHGAKAWNY